MKAILYKLLTQSYEILMKIQEKNNIFPTPINNSERMGHATSGVPRKRQR